MGAGGTTCTLPEVATCLTQRRLPPFVLRHVGDVPPGGRDGDHLLHHVARARQSREPHRLEGVGPPRRLDELVEAEGGGGESERRERRRQRDALPVLPDFADEQLADRRGKQLGSLAGGACAARPVAPPAPTTARRAPRAGSS